MSYDDKVKQLGRKPVVIIEIDCDRCPHVYGEAPCNAEVGVTGNQKCYNTRATCQDPENYAIVKHTYRHCESTAEMPIGHNVYADVKSVGTAPTEIKPDGFSVSARADIVFQDFPDDDQGTDPYVNEPLEVSGRPSTPPEERGTFWSKFLARNPYYQYREVRKKVGFPSRIGEDWQTNWKTYTYFIESISSPDSNGRVKLVAKDVLTYSRVGRRFYPEPSDGITLSAMTAVQTTLTLLPEGIGDSYPNSGIIRIGDEIMTYSGRTDDVLTGLARGQFGSEAETHDAEDSVQLCIRYENETVPDVLFDLFVNGAGIDPVFIPKAEWDSEAAQRLQGLLCSRVLSVPRDISDIVNSLVESAQVQVWFDEIFQEIRFKAIAPPLPTDVIPVYNDEEHLLLGSVSFQAKEELRRTRVVYSYGMINQAGDVRPENMARTYMPINAGRESESQTRSSKVTNIVSEWFTNQAAAESVANRILLRYQDTPQEAKFAIDAADVTRWTGETVDLNTRLFVDFDGVRQDARMIITSAREIAPASMFEFVALTALVTRMRTGLIAPDDMGVYTEETEENHRRYVFISNDEGRMSNGDEGYSIA